MIFETSSIKNYGHIWNQHVRISVTAKFCEETKCLKLGPKMPYLDILDQECLIWVFLGKNFFKKVLPYLKSASWNLSTCKISRKYKNAQIWEPRCLIWAFLIKNALFGYFCARISENYCHIWNQFPPIFLIAEVLSKTKMPKFGTKTALLGYFWPEMPYLGNFGQEF